eukprot:scaffold2144_cov18-Tisochrysis_lutea.AAC.1
MRSEQGLYRGDRPVCLARLRILERGDSRVEGLAACGVKICLRKEWLVCSLKSWKSGWCNGSLIRDGSMLCPNSTTGIQFSREQSLQ